MLPAGEIWNFQQRCPVPCSAFHLFLFWKSVYCLSLWWEAGAGPTEGALSEEDWGGSRLWKRQFKGLKSLTGEVSQNVVPGSELTASLILQLTVLIGLLQLNRLWWYSSHSCNNPFVASCSLELLYFLSPSVGMLPLTEIKDPCGWRNYHLHIWRPLCLWWWDILHTLHSPPESTNRLCSLYSIHELLEITWGEEKYMFSSEILTDNRRHGRGTF